MNIQLTYQNSLCLKRGFSKTEDGCRYVHVDMSALTYSVVLWA